MPFEPERCELNEPRRYLFEVDRRDFIRLFGGGLLIVVAASDLAAQESGRGRFQQRAPNPELAAWLHIDPNGAVTVCTGKVEIGQNIRTSLAQTVADELRVPMSSITMVMGDTDKTPYDMGTFGSQTTPRMAPQLARAAATARQMLIEQAASRWQVDSKALTANDGRILGPGGKSVTFGELTKGQALTGSISANPPIESRDEWQVRGTTISKVDGRAFVTGAHEYTPDIKRPNVVYGRIIRPEGYNATLVSLDDSRAKAMAGVTVVREGDFLGVVASTERDAARAASSVQATWKIPPGQPSSDTIYEYLKKNPESDHPAAIAQPVPASAARVFEASYRIPYIAHTPLEPRAAVAEWVDGKLTVWTGTQRPFGVRSELADAFHIPEERVRVIMPDMGSAYGGKHTGEAAIEAARLSKAVNRPVKLVWTRPEEFMWAYFRPAGVIDVKSAVDSNGRIVHWAFDNWNSGGSGLQTPYDIPSRAETFHPAKTPLRQGSYRALAATANHYAREMHMDEMARALSVDALDFRMTHLKEDRLRAVLKAAADKIGWPAPPKLGGKMVPRQARDQAGQSRSLGIACGTEKGDFVATAAEVVHSGDAWKVQRIVVAFECGAIVDPGGLHNQIEGGVIQALGGALFEKIQFADGQILNGTLEQYRVPRFKDVPSIDVVLVDRRDLPSAGAGETSLMCVAPAIGSALRAFGKVDTALPIRLRPA
jgi:nicotinate dehydrogenase subunit B